MAFWASAALLRAAVPLALLGGPADGTSRDWNQMKLEVSSGFGVASESSAVLSAEVSAAAKRTATTSGSSTMSTLALEQSAGAQVVKNRLVAMNSHLTDARLRVEEYTNQFEMGLHPIPHYTGKDADALNARLDKPLKKAEEALLDLKTDANDASVPMAKPQRDGLTDAMSTADRALASCRSASDSVRHGDNPGSLKHLEDLRDNVDHIEGVIENTFK